METWKSQAEKFNQRVDANAQGLDVIMRKYKPMFDATVKSAFKKWAVDDVITPELMYEPLTKKEMYQLKAQIKRWIVHSDYKDNKQFVTKMERMLKMPRMRRTDWLDLNFHKTATLIKKEQYGYYVSKLYNDWLDSSRSVARLLNRSFTVAGDDVIYKAINRSWHGSDLMSRVYHQATDLAGRWLNAFKKSIGKLGKKLEDLMPMFKYYFGKGDGKARNLMKIQSTRINTESKIDAFKKLDIKYYQFIAVMDSRTTTVCRRHDLKVYKVSDGVLYENLPPLLNEQFHTCRSTIRNYEINDLSKKEDKEIPTTKPKPTTF